MTKEYILTLVRADVVVPIQGHELISLSQGKTMQNETLIRYTLHEVNVATGRDSLQRSGGQERCGRLEETIVELDGVLEPSPNPTELSLGPFPTLVPRKRQSKTVFPRHDDLAAAS